MGAALAMRPDGREHVVAELKSALARVPKLEMATAALKESLEHALAGLSTGEPLASVLERVSGAHQDFELARVALDIDLRGTLVEEGC